MLGEIAGAPTAHKVSDLLLSNPYWGIHTYTEHMDFFPGIQKDIWTCLPTNVQSRPLVNTLVGKAKIICSVAALGHR